MDSAKQLSARRKSVQFKVEVFDERDTQCGIARCPTIVVSDIRFVVPLSLLVVFIQGAVSAQENKDIGLCLAAVFSSLIISSIGRDHKPRWLGAGTLCTALACLILSVEDALELNEPMIRYAAHFCNGLGMVSYVTLGVSYIDDNFQRHLPIVMGLILGIGSVGSLIKPTMAPWLVMGAFSAIAAMPISLMPKIINRHSNFNAAVVSPMDDPSKMRERRNSILSCLCNPVVICNAAACAFFLIAAEHVCTQMNKGATEVIGFVLLGWFIQFVKPKGRILAAINVFCAIGIGILATVNALFCGCTFVTTAAFAVLLFLSCCGRLGSFLFCIRTVDIKDKPIALGLTILLICILILPLKLVTTIYDYRFLYCQYCPAAVEVVPLFRVAENSTTTEPPFFNLNAQSIDCDLTKSCCHNNQIPSFIALALAVTSAFCDFLIFRVANQFDVYGGLK